MRLVFRIVLYLVLVAVVGLLALAIFSDLPAPQREVDPAGRGKVTEAAARLAGLAAALARSPSPCPASPPSRAAPSPGSRRASRSAAPRRRRAAPRRAARQTGADAITVTPLGDIRRDAVGLLPPERTGFARALWGDGSAAEVRALILEHPDQGVPEARALFHRLLLAEADPPQGAGSGDSVLVARIDRLLEIGALEEARALIDRAGPDTPELFRRWFDTGLLLEQSAEPCAALRQNPALSPTLPARVFCLARGGDWNAAEITLTLGQQVGSIPEAEQALLARFLDPVLFEEEAEPPIPEPLTALDFLMREAVGLLPPARGAAARLPAPRPRAARADAHPHRRRRAAGAVGRDRPPRALRRLPLRGAGGLGRGLGPRRRGAGARRRRSTPADDPQALGPLILAADAALAARGLRVALARDYAGRLAALDPAALPADARPALAELLLLADASDAARHAAGPAPEPALRGAPRHRRGRPGAGVRRRRPPGGGARRPRRRPARRRPRGAAPRASRQRAAGPGDPRRPRPGAGGRRGRSPGAARGAPAPSAAPGRRRARAGSRCRPCSRAAADGGGRPLARALSRGDPGRARRLAQHHPLLCPRPQRLRRLPRGAGAGLRHAPLAARSRPTSSTRPTAAWRSPPAPGGSRRSASSTASPSSKAGARTTRRR